MKEMSGQYFRHFSHSFADRGLDVSDSVSQLFSDGLSSEGIHIEIISSGGEYKERHNCYVTKRWLKTTNHSIIET